MSEQPQPLALEVGSSSNRVTAAAHVYYHAFVSVRIEDAGTPGWWANLRLTGGQLRELLRRLGETTPDESF